MRWDVLSFNSSQFLWIEPLFLRVNFQVERRSLSAPRVCTTGITDVTVLSASNRWQDGQGSASYACKFRMCTVAGDAFGASAEHAGTITSTTIWCDCCCENYCSAQHPYSLVFYFTLHVKSFHHLQFVHIFAKRYASLYRYMMERFLQSIWGKTSGEKWNAFKSYQQIIKYPKWCHHISTDPSARTNNAVRLQKTSCVFLLLGLCEMKVGLYKLHANLLAI